MIFIISGWAFSYPIDKEQKYILYQLLCTWIGGTKCTIVSIHLETVLLMPNFTKFYENAKCGKHIFVEDG